MWIDLTKGKAWKIWEEYFQNHSVVSGVVVYGEVILPRIGGSGKLRRYIEDQSLWGNQLE
jgi:hypothetical protein